MAQFQMEFDDGFLDNLLSTDFDAIAEEALAETIPMLEQSMKNQVKKVIQHEGDSELANSLKASKPRKTKTDAWIATVTPRGYSSTKVYKAKNGKGRKTQRKYKVSNAVKAIWKEYGIPGRQPARPFINAAVNAVTKEVTEKMQEVYNRKVGAE